MIVEAGPLGTASFSTDRRYRYLLTRGSAGARVVFVMLNPASADASKDDRTIAQCRRFAARAARARQWPAHQVAIVNLYGFRTPSPRALFRADDPIGRDNDRYLLEAVHGADLLICAWGRFGRRGLWLLPQLRAPYRLGSLNADGTPRHPCRLASATRLLPFTRAG